MLQLLQPGVVHQIRVLTRLAFIPLNLKQYVLQLLYTYCALLKCSCLLESGSLTCIVSTKRCHFSKSRISLKATTRAASAYLQATRPIQGSGVALNFQSGHLSPLDAHHGLYLNFFAVLVRLLSGSLVLFIFLV